MNIIILEDDQAMACRLSRLVETCGDHVSAVTSSVDLAISMAMDLRPDLVIAETDLGEGGDGVDAAVIIRDRTRIKSILIGASRDYATRDRAQAAWPLDFLTKPFSEEVFTATLVGVGRLLRDNWAKRYLS